MSKTSKNPSGQQPARNRIAVVVAHPDDEVLGFGGVMARHADAGHEVAVLVMATGLAARARSGKRKASRAALSRLRQQALNAAGILGVSRIDFAEFPDNAMDGVPLLDVVQRVEDFFAEWKPQVVYTHHAGDLNIDHAITARAVLTAARPLPGSGINAIYAGEVLSSSEWGAPAAHFAPRRYVEVTAQFERKMQALGAYSDELRDFPHPRSINAVNHQLLLRGAESGVTAAEAFDILREVVRS